MPYIQKLLADKQWSCIFRSAYCVLYLTVYLLVNALNYIECPRGCFLLSGFLLNCRPTIFYSQEESLSLLCWIVPGKLCCLLISVACLFRDFCKLWKSQVFTLRSYSFHRTTEFLISSTIDILHPGVIPSNN